MIMPACALPLLIPSAYPHRYEDAVNGPLGPVVSASLGQMLDDFFQYAAELQQSLEQQGACVCVCMEAVQEGGCVWW